MSNDPSARVTSAAKTPCSRRSPSSSQRPRRSSRSMASTTSYDSSMMNGLSDGSVCLRSHGQPSGPRSFVMSCTSSSNERFMRRFYLLRSSFTATTAPMSNHVLIVATDPAAKAPAEVAEALSFTPVVAGSEQEALALLDQENFALIAVSGGSSPLLRAEAERKQPMARLLELPQSNGEELRTLMVRYLDRRAPGRFAAEERYRFLSTILESFTTTLELKEVLRRMVTITREEFAADRAWLLQLINETAEFASVRFSVSAPHLDNDLGDAGPVSLVNSRGLIRRAMESPL